MAIDTRTCKLTNVLLVLESVSTEAMLKAFADDKPDFVVVDPMVSGAVNACDKFGVPYVSSLLSIYLSINCSAPPQPGGESSTREMID